MAFSPDGKRLATGEHGQDGEGVGRGDRPGGPRPQGAHGARSRAWRSAPTANASPPRAADKTVKVWDAATGQEALTLKGHRCQERGVQPRRHPPRRPRCGPCVDDVRLLTIRGQSGPAQRVGRGRVRESQPRHVDDTALSGPVRRILELGWRIAGLPLANPALYALMFERRPSDSIPRPRCDPISRESRPLLARVRCRERSHGAGDDERPEPKGRGVRLWTAAHAAR